MHDYQLYGLSLRSHWPLPWGKEQGPGRRVELRPGTAAFFSRLPQRTRPPGRGEAWFHHTRLADDSLYLRWSNLFEFHVSADGRRILGRPLNGISRAAFQTYLVGQVLSFALLRQGIEPLHSTTVVVNGEAVAFLGDCGYGKSSLGAAFLRAGHRLLTDDLLVVKEEKGRFLAQPGPPRLKLFPEVARAVLGKEPAGVPMNPSTPKLVLPLAPGEVAASPAPLRAFYLLPAGGAARRRIGLRRLRPRQAFLALVANTFNPVITESGRLARQFQTAAQLAEALPVKALSFPRGLERLPAVVEAVERDLGR